jgi:hypothetical protein
MLPPAGACENALPKEAATIVLIDTTSSNADADTTVASFKLTFINVLEAARVITVISHTTFSHVDAIMERNDKLPEAIKSTGVASPYVSNIAMLGLVRQP